MVYEVFKALCLPPVLQRPDGLRNNAADVLHCLVARSGRVALAAGTPHSCASLLAASPCGTCMHTVSQAPLPSCVFIMGTAQVGLRK